MAIDKRVKGKRMTVAADWRKLLDAHLAAQSAGEPDELEENARTEKTVALTELAAARLSVLRLGVYGVLGHSLKTTNCIESVNALIEERCAKVDHWKTSNQRQRWLATALTDIEPRLRKVMGYRHLPKLREALKREPSVPTSLRHFAP